MPQFTKKYIDTVISGIYDGSISERDLPVKLYNDIADYLKSGAYKGFGIDYSSLTKKLKAGGAKGLKFDTSDLELLGDLRENIYMFSAAKTYQQVKHISSLIIDDKGTLRSFGEFKKDAIQVFDTYNNSYLKTEYETAIGQAQNAVKWNTIIKQADALPLLKYDAVMDKNTSDICRPLNGIVAPVGDPIWKKIMPLNHFNCRCLVHQMADGEARPTRSDVKDRVFKETTDKMDDVFKMNPGIDGYIFKKDHPYFTVPKKDKPFAQKNFGLKIPKHD